MYSIDSKITETPENYDNSLDQLDDPFFSATTFQLQFRTGILPSRSALHAFIKALESTGDTKYDHTSSEALLHRMHQRAYLAPLVDDYILIAPQLLKNPILDPENDWQWISDIFNRCVMYASKGDTLAVSAYVPIFRLLYALVTADLPTEFLETEINMSGPEDASAFFSRAANMIMNVQNRDARLDPTWYLYKLFFSPSSLRPEEKARVLVNSLFALLEFSAQVPTLIRDSCSPKTAKGGVVDWIHLVVLFFDKQIVLDFIISKYVETLSDDNQRRQFLQFYPNTPSKLHICDTILKKRYDSKKIKNDSAIHMVPSWQKLQDFYLNLRPVKFAISTDDPDKVPIHEKWSWHMFLFVLLCTVEILVKQYPTQMQYMPIKTALDLMRTEIDKRSKQPAYCNMPVNECYLLLDDIHELIKKYCIPLDSVQNASV